MEFIINAQKRDKKGTSSSRNIRREGMVPAIIYGADTAEETISLNKFEIAKNLDDPEQVEKLVNLFDERKREPADYRRSGLVTLFVGVGLFLFGLFFLGDLLKGVGALVFAIGLGQIIAGYVYPNTSEEINKAVEDYEEK